MAKTHASKVQKGKRLEKLIALRLRETDLDKDAKIMPMSGAIEGFKGDVFTRLPVSFEAKNQETWKIPEWWDQATSQAGLGKMPVLVISRNYCLDPLAVIRFEDLLTLMQHAVEGGWVSYIRKGRTTIK